MQYSGPYVSWNQATDNSIGWDSEVILEMVTTSTLQILLGNFPYERDGHNFEELPQIDPARQILKELLTTNSTVVDFGGSLGGTYLTNRQLFDSNKVDYFCVEQSAFATRGALLATEYNLPISFVASMNQVTSLKADFIIFSGVLQYLENWKSIVQDALRLEPDYFLIDRTPLQHKYSQIYVQENYGYYNPQVTYPSWVFEEMELLGEFKNYSVVRRWISPFDPDNHCGYLLKKNLTSE